MHRASVGVGIGGDSEDEDFKVRPERAEKSGQSKSIQISSGQFEEEEIDQRSKEMGTDYDPPARYEEGSDLSSLSQ